MKDNQHNYQFILVLSPKTEDKEREKTLTKIESWLQSNKADIAKKEHTGSKDLVYAIKGLRKGDFWMLDIKCLVPLNLKELNLLLNREVNVIRYLILKI
jgi:ribosomal protein S6